MLGDILGKRLIMVGGKGGVGKTTCASAMALFCAERGKSTLLLSSDPTPSLSDIFEIEIGPTVRRIPKTLNLYAQEISSEVILKRWRERFGGEIYEVVRAFTDLDEDFVLQYIGSAPGIEEEYMLYYIYELTTKGTFDIIVWDTAPAGHTLKLLKLPTLFLKHLEGATRFYLQLMGYVEKAKEAVKLKAKRGILEIVDGWRRLSEEIESFIKDKGKVSYVLVTIPEALGVKQTERILSELKGNGLWVNHLIVNQVITEADCPFHQRKKEMQKGYLSYLRNRFPSLPLTLLRALPEEVKGMERIKEVQRLLFGLAKSS
ncbi:MAG: hypothetical protein DRG31_00920 [Deltaproteobacteria bacterium]|nr:MAG: hypothetical protein DRG31_00920 [Deltaproteobacteria bacterium]